VLVQSLWTLPPCVLWCAVLAGAELLLILLFGNMHTGLALGGAGGLVTVCLQYAVWFVWSWDGRCRWVPGHRSRSGRVATALAEGWNDRRKKHEKALAPHRRATTERRSEHLSTSYLLYVVPTCNDRSPTERATTLIYFLCRNLHGLCAASPCPPPCNAQPRARPP